MRRRLLVLSGTSSVLAALAGLLACTDAPPTAVPRSSGVQLLSASQLAAARTAPVRSSVRDGVQGPRPSLLVTPTPNEDGSTTYGFDFEELWNGWPVGDFFHDYGVYFDNATAYSVYNAGVFPPNSGHSVITATIPGSGVLTVTFVGTVAAFGAYATSIDPLRLACFDSAGATVGTKDYPTPNANDGHSVYAPNQYVEVAGAGITRCSFSGTNNGYSLDDFRVRRFPDVHVTCSPSPLYRGQATECTATGFAVVNEWRFKPDSSSLPVVRDSNPGYDTTWSGPIAASGTVYALGWHLKKDAFSSKPRDSASVYLPVKPRTEGGPNPWVPLQLPDEPDSAGQGALLLMPDSAGRITFGLFTLQPPTDWYTRVALRGPNRGYAWVDSEPKLPKGVVNINNVLKGEGDWAAAQDGSYNGQTRSPSGYPYCKQRNLTTFARVVRRHEGLTSDSTSHFGLWQRLLKNSDLHKQLEAVVAAGSTQDAANKAGKVFTAWGNLHKVDQDQFDSTEYGGNRIRTLAGGCDWVPVP